MTAEQIVDEVSREMGMPEEMIEQAKLYATMTALTHGGRMSVKKDLNDEDAHVVRMYFRTLLFRIATEPEYRRELRAELQRRVERN